MSAAKAPAPRVTRLGVLFSHASETVGPLVQEADDPWELKRAVEAAQPGVRGVVVHHRGDGDWRTARGLAPRDVLAALERTGADLEALA